MKGRFDNWLFGCDVCQDVCPWNSFAKPALQNNFPAITEILDYPKSDWESLTEEKFKIIFQDSPLKRTKFSGIKRNLQFIQQL